MDKVYQVFVSSTYSDLKEERKRVAETLAKAGFISAGMELFPAADQEALQFIERIIDRCDYYVVIIGGRYGSLADHNVSFTEKEYEYAVSKGIPVLAFLHAEPERIAVGKTDLEPTKAAKLKAFRDRLARGRLVRTWYKVDDLCTEVVISIVNESTRVPGIGWVRGDQAIDPKVLQEMERLRIENTEFKKRLVEMAEDEMRFPSHLADPATPFEFTIAAFGRDQIAGSPKIAETIIKKSVSIKAVFVRLGDFLQHKQHLASEDALQEQIGRIVCGLTSAPWSPGEATVKVSHRDVRQLRFHLEALELIEVKSELIGSRVLWELTKKGRRYIAMTLAIPKKEKTSQNPSGAVAGLVGIEGGVVSGVFNLESLGVRAPSRRPRHDKRYHEARTFAADDRE